MLKKTKSLAMAVIVCILMVAFAHAVGFTSIMSNTIGGETTVTEILPLTVTVGAGGGGGHCFPTDAQIGSSFVVSVNVFNPNAVNVSGSIMLNFTSPNLTSNSVYVCGSVINPEPVSVTLYVDIGYTSRRNLIFYVQSMGCNAPYFMFTPGRNDNVAFLTVLYRIAGVYNWTMNVYQ